MTTRPWLRGRSLAAAAFTTTLGVALALVPASTALAADAAGGTTAGTAVALPVADLDSSVVVTNVASSSAGSRNTSTMPYWNNTTWFSYTPAETVRVYVRATSVSPGGWDNTLEIWDGATLVVENDDSYGLDAAVLTTLQGGTTYRLAMGGYNMSSRGSATLTFSTRVPSAPLDVQLASRDAAAGASWTAPTDLAGGVTSYQVLCTPDGGDEYPCGSTAGTPPATSASLTGLTNGSEYSVRVVASNLIGPSDPSAPASTVPLADTAIVLTTDPVAPVSGAPFDVVATVSSHGSGVTDGTLDLTVDGTTTSALTLVDGRATVPGLTRLAGNLSVSASYAGTTVLRPSTAAATVVVAKKSQTVTLTTLPTDLTYAGTPVPVSATASSGFTVSVTASGSCAIGSGSLFLTGVGTCHLEAAQAGDDQTLAASASQTVEVGKRPQTVTLAPLPSIVYGQHLTLAPLSSAGLPVTLTASGACLIADHELSASGIGPCSVTASQAGTSVDAAATAVVRTSVVAKRPQTVTFTPLSPLTFGLVPTVVQAASDLGLPVTITGAGACRVTDGLLTTIGSGPCTLTATATGDEVSEPGSAALSLDVRGVPSAVVPDLGADLGSQAQGARVTARGEGLRPGSVLVLEVHSTPQVVGTAIVGADGTTIVTGVLPDLEPGEHHLVAIGTALDGTEKRDTVTFAVTTTGSISRIENRALPSATRSAAALAQTGAQAGGVLALALTWIVLGCAAVAVRRRIIRPRP